MAGKRANGEGSIYQQKDGRWVGAVTLPTGERKRYYGKTRRDVHDRLTKALKARQEGLPIALDDRLTVGQYLDHWLEKAEAELRASTYRGYEAKIRQHIKPGLGKVRLTALAPRTVEAFLRERHEARLSAQSVHHLRAILRAALADAVRKGALVRNVAALADEPRVPQHEIQPLSPQDARRLLDAVKGDRLEALCSVAMALGLRQGEALGLHWADVDLKGRTLRVRCALQWDKGEVHFVEPKSQRSRRTIALPEAVVKALQAHWDRQQFEKKEAEESHASYTDLDLVFCKSNGQPLQGTNLTVSFQRLLKRNGIRRQRFHDLRHTCASLLLAQGVHPRVVMEVLGRSNINLTMNTYSHVIPDLQREAADKMDAILANTAPASSS